MQTHTDVQAPPSGQPTPPSTPAPTTTSTTPADQLPVTGPSDVATGALATGLPMLLLGVVILVVLRRRRLRTG